MGYVDECLVSMFKKAWFQKFNLAPALKNTLYYVFNTHDASIAFHACNFLANYKLDPSSV